MIEATFPPVQIKPVLGKGREKRWEAFQEIFKSACGDKNSLIENATTRKDLRYRLIQEKGGQPIGIAIFSDKLSASFEKLFGLKSALRVKALHLNVWNENFGKELIHFASLSKAKSIIVDASKKDEPLKQFMDKIGFKKMKSVTIDNGFCFSYVIKEVKDEPIEPNPKERKVEIEEEKQ